jgi:hypothetical protein
MGFLSFVASGNLDFNRFAHANPKSSPDATSRQIQLPQKTRNQFIHEAFLEPACCIICWRQRQNSFC